VRRLNLGHINSFVRLRCASIRQGSDLGDVACTPNSDEESGPARLLLSADFVAEVAEHDGEALPRLFGRPLSVCPFWEGTLTDWPENGRLGNTLIDAGRRSGDQLRKPT